MTITLKITRKKVLIALLAVAVVAAALTTCQMLLRSDAVAAFMQKGPRGGSEEERQSFIASLGYKVDPEPIEVVEIRLPKNFDGMYTAYDEMQRERALTLANMPASRPALHLCGAQRRLSPGCAANLVVQNMHYQGCTLKRWLYARLCAALRPAASAWCGHRRRGGSPM